MSGIRTGPVLNFDVLLHIVSLAEMDTQSRVMKTCKALYRNGARELLRGEDVCIYTDKRLLSFLLFMHADPAVRIPCLHGLVLKIRTETAKEAGDSLVDLFLRLAECEHPAFRYLCLQSSKDLFLANHQLARAVARLHTVTSVIMESAGIQAAAVLQLLGRCSPLTRASINFCEDLLSSPSVTAEQLDPLHLLRYCRDTLTELSIEHWFLATRKFCVYPRLTTLTLSGDWTPATPKLRRAFPNLSELTVYGYANIPERRYASQRESNRNDQLVHGTWAAPMRSFWGGLYDLYVLAPISRIEYITLDYDTNYQNTNARWLRAILMDARPAHLELRAELHSGLTLLSDDWMNALTEQRNPQLQILQIELQVLGGDDSADLGQALDNLYAAVVCLKLAGFRLRINAWERARDDEHLEECIKNFDVGEYAHRIKESTPSMQLVSITLDADREEPYKKVRVGSSEKDLFVGGDHTD
ncbi:hypothetical protein L227DRAFT_579974 [Lentinus tigrinus ALCF2SS1-6]|uniref:F-box domain-containing protein n=2 Tax=Lentinus tigrinus TaxID=5365 RepID=A0A5C2RVT7_9APHY|nr:hypothetical protein L227DRAFT_579974 [Lentinus tigrinus ALCF2SS1-6]